MTFKLAVQANISEKEKEKIVTIILKETRWKKGMS